MGCVGLGLLVSVGGARQASAQETQIKPYILIMLETSTSMDASTGSGMNTCGQQRNRINDAK